MTSLAHTLGLRNDLVFYDVYSLTDADLLSFIPRPALALLVIIPMSPAWKASREEEDSTREEYAGSGDGEPVIWFKQTIRHACGLIGLIHCLCNLPDVPETKNAIQPGSLIDRIKKEVTPLKQAPRAQYLYDSEELEAAHQSHAQKGDSAPPENPELWDDPHHFVTFAKGKDGQLWELEGDRKGPVARGQLGADEDVLSETAYKLGMGKVLEQGKENLRFSAIVLAPGGD